MNKIDWKNPTRRQMLGAGAAGTALAIAGCSAPGPEDEANLKAAQKVLGLEFSEAENAQLAEGLQSQLDMVQTLRAQIPPNNVHTAQVFNPQLKARQYPRQNDEVSLHSGDIPALPQSADDIAFAPLTHLSHWIRTGQISSVELTALYLERAKRFDPLLECFVTITEDLAMSEASAADAEIATGTYRSALHGIPYGLKDLMDTKGIRTTWGAGPYKDRVAEDDAHIVQKLREAGAVLLGKTTCGALAWGDVWFGGVTRNPWNPLEGASGSSAGSGSATSAGLVGFAIGTETLGSIVSPANRNGIVGLRPTFGRVGRSGTMALCWSLDKIGPMCRGVEDTALVLGALNGPDHADPSNRPHGFGYDGDMDISRLRLGYDPRFLEMDNAVDLAAIEAARGLGMQVVEVQTPERDVNPLRLQLSIEAAAAFQDLTLSNRDGQLRRQIKNAWPNVFREAHMISAVDLIQVDRLRRQVMEDMAQMFDQCDVFIGPNYAHNMLLITNYTGQPQLSIPAGMMERDLNVAWEETRASNGQSDTLPRNISLWADLYQEGPLIAVGRALEAALDMSHKRPDFA